MNMTMRTARSVFLRTALRRPARVKLHLVRLIAFVAVITAGVGAAWADQAGPPAAGGDKARSLPPRVEVFAGYSFLPAIQIERSRSAPDSDHGHGVAASVHVNVGRPFGPKTRFDVGGDVDWQTWLDRGVDGSGVSYTRGDERASVLYLSAGPRFGFEAGKVTAFWLISVDILKSHYGGYQWSNRSLGYIDQFLPARSGTAWGPGLGGGVDLQFRERLTIRLAQVNYSLFNIGGERPDQRLRLKTGIVFGFG